MKKYYFILLINYIVFAQTTPQQMVERMSTGINLGNILSAPYEGNWADPLTENYIDKVSRLRFKHVRIPVRFDNQTTPLNNVNYTGSDGSYIGSPSNYTVNASYLNRIEEIVNWCLNRNLVVIIDIHGDHWFWESYDETSPYYKTGNDRLAAIDRFKAIWRDVAIRFQNKPDDLVFEIMNEPFFSMNAQEVIDINTQMLAVIRQTNPTRNVIVTGGGANSYDAPMQLTPAFLNSDDYLIATFHYYRPFNFTSSGSAQYTDNDWGTASDFQAVNTHFDAVSAWSQTNSIPIYMGEFGADNVNGFDYENNTVGLYGGPDEISRYLYHHYIAQAARNRGFSLGVWDAGEKSGKTIYLNASQGWVKDIRNAVLNASCQTQSLINNADIECNYDYSWNTTFNPGYTGKLNNSTPIDGYQNSVSLHAKINTSLGSFSGVTISNSDFTSNFVAGENYTVSCLAKGNSNQQFQFRIKLIINGTTSFLNSVSQTLTNQYSTYSYTFIVPADTTQLTVQLLCGKNTGDYFFDNFTVESSTLNISENITSRVQIYPTPASTVLNFSNESTLFSVEGVYNFLGQKVSYSEVSANSIDISALPQGIYYLVLSEKDSNNTIKKTFMKK